MISEHCDDECGPETSEGSDVSFDAKAGHRDEENNERQSGENGGEEPRTEWIVTLKPGSYDRRRLPVDNGDCDEDDGGDEK